MENKLEALRQAKEYIENFIEVANSTIAAIQVGEDKNVYNVIAQMSEGIEWLLNIFKLTTDIQIQKINTNGVTNVIENIVQAIENKDFILLQDTMQYELIEQLLEWKREIAVTLDYCS